MLGIDCCDVKMKPRYYHKFSTNVFMIESLVSLRHQVLIYDIFALACLLLSKLLQRKKYVRQNFVLH